MTRYGVVQLTEGNIRNDHLYLASVIELFPKDSVGGNNRADAAARTIELHTGVTDPVITDIAGDKKIFRKRAWVHEFISAHELKAGDRVAIEKTGAYRFHVYPQRNDVF